jgi:thiazole/oxazole-forming peptide maturase SagD family component
MSSDAVRHARRLTATTVLLAGAPELTAPLAEILAPVGYARVETLTGLDATFAAVPEDTVVVAAFAHPAHHELTALDAFCAAHGIRFLPFRGERGQGIAGPAGVPGIGPDFADALARRRSTTPGFDAAEAPPGPPFRPLDARWLLTTLAVQLERWVTGEPAEITTGELELDPARLTVRPRPVLPMPDRPRPVEPRDPRPELLLDERTGIVTDVRELPAAPGMPARLRMCEVDVADMRQVADWPNDRRASGAAWHDFDLARDAAIGEAVERYCGSWLPPDREIRHASYRRLRRDGVPALDPRRLNLSPLAPDAECGWIEAFSHTTREAVWVPATLVSPQAEPGGLAAGTSAEHAVTAGLEDVLGHDAAAVWWANAARLPRLPVPAEIRALIADTADTHDVTLIPLDNEFGVPIVAAAVFDRVRRWLSVGFATRPDALEAAKDALAGGFGLQHTFRTLDDERARAGLARPRDLKPHRADRRYLDSYRDDFADVTDPLCRQQLYLDPRAAARVAPWTRDLPVRGWDGLPALGERRLKAYRDRVEARGFEVLSVDLTTRDVAAAGFHAARTLVPGLVTAGLPHRGDGRVRRAAVDLGWRSEPLPEEELNVFPLPHP